MLSPQGWAVGLPATEGTGVLFWNRMVWAVLALVLLPQTSARADDVQNAAAGVVRVVAVGEDTYGMNGSKGTGFAIAPGVILTNAHVIENAYDSAGRAGVAVVPSRAARPVRARIIAFDRDKDMALLRVEGAAIAPLTIFSGVIAEGTSVSALGYPGNVDAATDADALQPRSPVRATGNFSNVERIRGIDALLHTADINHGNSGGPLTDDCGRVIGVNTFTTADNRGGAGFAFAISTNELLAFARRNGVTATINSDQCVTTAMRESIAAAEKLKQDLTLEREKSRIELERVRQQAEQTRRAAEEVQAQRENYLAAAAVLLVLAGLVAVLGMNHRSAGREDVGRKWLIGAGVLAVIAAAAFFLRPSLTDADLPASALPAATDSPTDAASAGASDAAAAEQAAYSCTLDPGRSQLATAERDVVPVAMDDSGCVNGRTQYASVGGNTWQRISVLGGEDTVVRMSFDRANRTFIQERWAVDPDVMSDVREIRDAVMPKGCAADPARLAQLADAQRQVVGAMTSEPSERRVYSCRTGN